MRLAIVASTEKGALLAERLARTLNCGQVAVYARQGGNPCQVREYDGLAGLVQELFPVCDGLIFILPVDIAVRVAAPCLADKRIDPAVVVVDEDGRYAVSLLSGHLGGANRLAEKIGAVVGAKPVITTATDVHQLPAVDLLAARLNLRIEPFNRLKTMNAALVSGRRVHFFVDSARKDYESIIKTAGAMGIELKNIEQLADSEQYDAAVIISDKPAGPTKPHIFLRSGGLAAGIGCRKGASETAILTALEAACRTAGQSIKDIVLLASVDVKRREAGLLAAAEELAVPIRFFGNKAIEETISQYRLNTSAFVKQQIGVGNVCEAAALLAGRSEQLILPKTIYPKVTVALAAAKYRSWE